MKKVCSIIILIVMLFIIITLAGCWNYSDVEEQFVVMGLAIDYDEEKQEYILHAEVSRAKGGSEAQSITRIESAEGKTLFQANRNLISKVGAKVYWGHAMVYIISERVAEKGITDVIGILSKLTQVRTDIFILVTDNESIDKIFEFEDPIHEDVSQHIQDLMNNYESSGEFRKAPLFKVIQELGSDEVSVMLPYVKMIDKEEEEKEKEGGEEKKEEEEKQKEEKVQEILITDGTIVFKKDKMVGKLDPKESLSALILRKEINKSYALTNTEDDNLPNTTVEVINSDLKVNTYVDDADNLYLIIELEIEADLVEIQSEEEYAGEEKKKELEKGYEQMLKKQLSETIKKTQTEQKADIFSFAGYTHRQQKDFWKANSVYWDTIYEEAIVDVKVDVKINSSALTFMPVEVGN